MFAIGGTLARYDVLVVALIAFLGSIAAAEAVYKLLGHDLEDPLEQIGTFLTFAVGGTVAVVSVFITYRISSFANTIAQRIGDADILNFVDARLRESLNGLRSLARVLDAVHETSESFWGMLEPMAEAFSRKRWSEETKKAYEEALSKAREAPGFNEIVEYNLELEFSTNILMEVADGDLLKLRRNLQKFHRTLRTALVAIEEAPVTLALTVHRALKSGDGEENAKYREIALQHAVRALGEEHPLFAFEPANLHDIVAELSEALERQGALDEKDDDLRDFARNLMELILLIIILSEEMPSGIVLLGALIDFVPIFKVDVGEAKDGEEVGIVFNRGLMLLATIFEILPDRTEFENFFNKVYDDRASRRLAKCYVDSCGFTSDSFWTSEARQNWEEARQKPDRAVQIMVRDAGQRQLEPLNIRLVAPAALAPPPAAQAFWPWNRRAKREAARDPALFARKLPALGARFGFGPSGDPAEEGEWLRAAGLALRVRAGQTAARSSGLARAA